MTGFSVNARAAILADALAADAAALKLMVRRGSLGERVIDAGSAAPGSLEAGRRIAEICLGGLGDVSLSANGSIARWPWSVTVHSSQPVIACLASQYAGWSLSHDGYFALGSGPARALAQKEEIYQEIGYRDRAQAATLVLESDTTAPPEIIAGVAADCGVAPADLTVIFAPTRSLAGGLQVVARVLEVALHKAHALHFPLDRIADGFGSAPLAPPHPDFVTAMGRTNDAIIFGGRVQLFVTGPAADAKALAEQLPPRLSRDYGRPFAEIFAAYNGDFYAMDPMLFSPAEALVTAIDSGETFRAGALHPELLDASFG